MEPVTRLRKAQFQAGLYLYGGMMVLAAACVAVFLFVWRQSALSRPQLTTNPGPTTLSETLGWPWPGFPPVAPVERETIQREFRLDEPLVAADLRPWNVMPSSPLLRPHDDVAVSEMNAALDAIRALPAPGDEVPDDGGGAEGSATEYDPAIRLLTLANNAQPSRWVVLYDRGVLNFRKGSYRAAERDLAAALNALQPALDSPSGAEVYEAAIHTYYALGHAVSRAGEGEPESRQVERRSQAIGSFRTAVRLIRPLFDLRDPSYASVSNSLEFFPLRPTRVSTAAVAGDLVAAYLAAPGYHDCEERPGKGDPCASLDRRAPCYYRDRVFCNSLTRSGGAFTRPFIEQFHRFYGGDATAWGDEHHLWALSNAVDRMAGNADIGDDPYLLYNLGSLLIQVGEPKAAADLLERAVDALSGSGLPPEDVDRITRLSTVASVLAGDPPRGGRAARDRNPSLLRQAYERLYGEGGENAPHNLKPFAPVGAAFNSDAEALLDRWLFLRLWRTLLAEGDFEGYLHEYGRLMAEPEVPHDFFRRWHDETLAVLGDKALKRADALQKEPERAEEIRTFVSDQGEFPPEIESRARGGASGWALWAARRFVVLATGLALGLILLWAAVWAIGLVRGHRETFFSAHRRRRKGSLDAAYPR
jgi:tetratricopeptide (TPR) repeat protein